MFRSLAALASAVVVLALPAGALAHYGPGDGSQSYSLPAPTNYLFDGKYLQQAPSPAAVEAVSTTRAGFDYGDAAIGAAVGALVVVIVGGTVLVVRFEHNGRQGHAAV